MDSPPFFAYCEAGRNYHIIKRGRISKGLKQNYKLVTNSPADVTIE